MANLFSFFPLSPLGATISMLFFGATGTFVVVYDLLRMNRESNKELQLAWYERPLLWLSGSGIVAGLVMGVDRLIATLPGDWPAMISFLGFIAMQYLFVICFIIALAKSGNSQEKKARPVHAAPHGFSPHALLRKSPLFTSTRASLIAWVYLGLMVIWWICGSFLHLMDRKPFVDYLFLVLGLFTIWGLRRTFALLQQFKHIERLRLAFAERTRPEAAAFAPVFPFQGPPQLLASALLLRQTWSALLGWFLYGLGFGLMFTQPILTAPALSILILKFAIMLLVASLVCAFRLSFRCKIEATQYSLTAGCGFQMKSIAWQDARLFACYRVPSFFFEYRTTMIYELSGPGQAVQWTRVMDARSSFALWRPVLPMDEYQRQMQQLCDLISAKTGLPLHELDEEKPMELRARLVQERTTMPFQERG